MRQLPVYFSMQLSSLPHGLLPSVPHGNCCFLMIFFYCMSTPVCFAWQLLARPHGNSYSTYMATTSFPLASTPLYCLVCSSIPSSQMAALAHHTFFHFLRWLPWQLFSSIFYTVHVLFLQGEEDYHTRDQAEPQRPTRTHTLKAVDRWQLRFS